MAAWVYAGAAAALGALVWLVRYDPLGVLVGDATPATMPALGGVWVPLTGAAAIVLAPGVRYRACVKFSFVSPLHLFSTDRVAAELVAMGFTNVRVLSGGPPPNWPADKACSWYVDATWSGALSSKARPAIVTFAWKWVPSS